jgi:hypothetical protein
MGQEAKSLVNQVVLCARVQDSERDIIGLQVHLWVFLKPKFIVKYIYQIGDKLNELICMYEAIVIVLCIVLICEHYIFFIFII